MQNLYDIITGLTTNSPTIVDRPTLLNKFANSLGWNPSYHLEPTKEADDVSIHLVVEHGLENTAILTFLKTPYSELTEERRNKLLNISYNNLVNWHIHVEKNKVTYVYNRLSPSNNVVGDFTFNRDQYEELRSEAFDKIIGRKPSPNIPALDDALIQTISFWKRAISAELKREDINETLATLFNIIIFVRAIEDNLKRYSEEETTPEILLWAWNELKDDESKGIKHIVSLALEKVGSFSIPDYLVDLSRLGVLGKLEKQTISYLFNDFYSNKYTSLYRYDFSIISMHALSRIYEKYIAILKVEEDPQMYLFPSSKNLAKEEVSRAFGSIFTPQYIARFFAQYVKENLTPAEFKRIRIAEPAVGSGIFLRSLLEIKCDPRKEVLDDTQIEEAFQNIFGIDIDPNATKATELSLALLQLVLINKFPKKLNIITEETIQHVQNNPNLRSSFDVVLSNPPYIATAAQTDSMQNIVRQYMGELGKGRIDIYLAFLKLSIDILKPGGYGLFVLPHSFTIATSAEKLRKYISTECWIRCFADLSAIEVFGNTGVYVILLIIQKKFNGHVFPPQTTVVKCKDLVGKALQDALKGNFVENDFYSVYEVDQVNFENSEQWFILPSKEIRLQKKVTRHLPLSEYLSVKQGFISGNDEVFVVKKPEIPTGEEKLYVPYIHDRKIDSYYFDADTDLFLFYPFINGERINEDILSINYPLTWKYLNENKDKILSNKSFQENGWWRPLRPRQPKEIMRSKIITPHLTITPKFAIDIEGKVTISHSPYLIPKSDDVKGDDLLLYFLAILNSTTCYWYISNHSHKYSKGYNMLEVKTLKNIPVPDPSSVPATTMKRLLDLVRERMKVKAFNGRQIEQELDNIVADLYGMNEEDKKTLGILN